MAADSIEEPFPFDCLEGRDCQQDENYYKKKSLFPYHVRKIFDFYRMKNA